MGRLRGEHGRSRFSHSVSLVVAGALLAGAPLAAARIDRDKPLPVVTPEIPCEPLTEPTIIPDRGATAVDRFGNVITFTWVYTNDPENPRLKVPMTTGRLYTLNHDQNRHNDLMLLRVC
jgi:hypothetical protein